MQGKSYVLSSFSVLSPLGQLALASVGPSYDQILKKIEIANDNKTKDLFFYVNNRLKDVQGVAEQANKVYLKNGLKLNDQFVRVSKQVFNTEVENINFSNSELAAEKINTWILEMKFEGEQTSFVVTLPNQIEGIDGLIEKMKDPTALNTALVNMSPQNVIVSLPRFKIETKTDLKDVLMKMNITKLFTPGEAHLDHLVKGTNNMFVSSAIQKTIFEVNEWGAETASGNAKVLRTMGASNDYREFKADHPFLFFLNQKGIILFSGLFRPA